MTENWVSWTTCANKTEIKTEILMATYKTKENKPELWCMFTDTGISIRQIPHIITEPTMKLIMPSGICIVLQNMQNAWNWNKKLRIFKGWNDCRCNAVIFLAIISKDAAVVFNLSTRGQTVTELWTDRFTVLCVSVLLRMFPPEAWTLVPQWLSS